MHPTSPARDRSAPSSAAASIALVFAALLASAAPARAQVSKGQLLLMDRGLQVQGMAASYDVFHLATCSNAGYTAIHWLWDATPGALGPAPGFPWARWVADEGAMPPRAGEEPYLRQLIALQLGDEWNLNDDATRTRLVDWFNAVRTNWPETILYHNSFGGQVGDAALADFVARAQPDMLSFDTYPWRSDYATSNVLGGPPTGWYGDLRRYREHARAANVPLACYLQTFHAVQHYDQTIFRDPSPSELRLNHFGALAFNAKVLIDFTYNTGASSLFTNSAGGDNAPNALYAEKADIARRARFLGRALTRLKPAPDTNAHTTSILFMRGKNSAGTPNPVPIGFLADPEAPNSYTDWTADRNDPYLRGWTVTNKGSFNNGQAGDVIVAWFKPLDESLDGPSHTNETYLMVVNGLTDPAGAAADCLQEIRLNFLNVASTANVVLLNQTNGLLQTNPLPLVNTRRQLVLNLPGGDAALFKFSDGAPFVGYLTPDPAQLDIGLDEGAPAVSARGLVGSRHRLETVAALGDTNWTTLTNLLLPSAPAVFRDASATNAPRGFYRTVVGP